MEIKRDVSIVPSKLLGAAGNDYDFRLNGFMLEIYNHDDQLLCVSDLVDNSVFILEKTEAGLAAANLLGAKRFIVGKSSVVEGAIQFPRDRYFKVNQYANVEQNEHIEIITGLEKMKKYFSEAEIYKKLAKIFPQSNFSDQKIAEFKDQNKSDKYCRFNSPSIIPIFMLYDSKLIGCIRLAKIPVGEEFVVYLSDEIAVHEKLDQKTLKGYLFNAARDALKSLPLQYAFIRISPAADSEELYTQLGCDRENTDLSVIHGSPTPLLVELQTFIKALGRDARLKFETPKSTMLASNTSDITLEAAAEEHRSFNP